MSRTGVQKLLGDENGIGTLALGEGLHLAEIHVPVDVFGLVLLGENHWHVVKGRRGQAGDADAGGLNGENPVHLTSCEPPAEFPSDLLQEGHVHLVVEKAVHLEHLVVSPDLSVPLNPLLQCFHKKRPFPHGF